MNWLLTLLDLLRRRRPVPAPPPPPGPGPDPAGFRGLLLSLVNRERVQRGLVGYAANARLDQVAQDHSDWMAAHHVLTHDQAGRSPWDRMRAAGYAYLNASENIALGYPDPAGAVAGWMASPGHRANILGDFAEAGFGRQGAYWTADFGSR